MRKSRWLKTNWIEGIVLRRENIDKKLEAIEKKYVKKIEGLENQLKKINKLVSEKNSLTSSFKNY